MRVEVVTGQGRVHLATCTHPIRGVWTTLCGMAGEVKPDGWMRPVSWPKDDKREFCRTCEARQ